MVATECPKHDQLEAYLLGTLEESAADWVYRHTEVCAKCQTEVVSLDGVEDQFLQELRGLRLAPPPNPSQPPEWEAALSRAKSLKPADQNDADSTFVAEAPPAGVEGITQMGAYRIEQRLGSGGMGTVYRARHQRLDKPVALKVIARGGGQNREIAKRFEREMLAVGRLEHPHLIRAYDAGESQDGRHLFLAMELAEGLDAGALVSRIGPLRIADACEILRQTALGLESIHQQGLVHRDIKPSNVMLAHAGDQEGQAQAVVKVLDLGLARFHNLTNELTLTGQVVGTLDYLSPEQIGQNQAVGSASDLYSLGCMGFKLLTGRAPFAEASLNHPLQKLQAHLEQQPPLLTQFRPKAPAKLAALIARLLAKQPGDRFASAAEAAKAFQPFTKGHDLAGLLKRAEHTKQPARDASGKNSSSRAKAATKTRASTHLPESAVETVALPKTKSILQKLSPRGRITAAMSALLLVSLLAAQIIITIRNKNGQKQKAKIQPGETATIDANGKLRIIPNPGIQAARIESGEAMGPLAIVDQPAKLAGVESWTIETIAPRGAVDHAVFRPDGKQVATLGSDRTIRLWNVETRQLERAFVIPEVSYIVPTDRPLAYSSDGKLLAYSSRSVRVWDTATGSLVMAGKPLENKWTGNVVISPDGKQLATVHYKTARIWDIAGGQQLALFDLALNAQYCTIPSYSPNGKQIAFLELNPSPTSHMDIWDIATEKRVQRLEGVGLATGPDFRPEVAWSPGGDRLAATMQGSHIEVWDAVSGKIISSLTVDTAKGYYGLAWTGDGKEIWLGNVRFNAETGKVVQTLSIDPQSQAQP